MTCAPKEHAVVRHEGNWRCSTPLWPAMTLEKSDLARRQKRLGTTGLDSMDIYPTLPGGIEFATYYTGMLLPHTPPLPTGMLESNTPPLPTGMLLPHTPPSHSGMLEPNTPLLPSGMLEPHTKWQFIKCFWTNWSEITNLIYSNKNIIIYKHNSTSSGPCVARSPLMHVRPLYMHLLPAGLITVTAYWLELEMV